MFSCTHYILYISSQLTHTPAWYYYILLHIIIIIVITTNDHRRFPLSLMERKICLGVSDSVPGRLCRRSSGTRSAGKRRYARDERYNIYRIHVKIEYNIVLQTNPPAISRKKRNAQEIWRRRRNKNGLCRSSCLFNYNWATVTTGCVFAVCLLAYQYLLKV